MGPTTPQEMAFSCVSTPMPAQRERAVELVVKMGMTVRTISRFELLDHGEDAPADRRCRD